ncbi:S8 family peptidase [Deinococcus humi]|uniref:Subtilisin family serine protease n=1 Tax=Deinococcus humi TaxID=662880 RepID=A0A7W8NGU3_9DEIO|nr:S8 family serine peptidase [Deinococcus humi]MBB5365130.1 subtilisin family serine protease [Deinococcus humi]GGO37854.1 serine protease [Deinococcus humi]
MSHRVLLPALLLPLLLTACPEQSPAPDPLACRSGSVASLGVAPLNWGQARADWSAARVPGQVLLLTERAAGTLSAQALGALSGVQRQAVGPGVQLARTPAGESDRAFAQRLQAAGLRVQPNYVYRALAQPGNPPNDPAFPGNAGLNIRVGDRRVNVFQTYLSRTRVPAAWDALGAAGRTPVGARVAVLDSAADRSHPDLRLSGVVSCLLPAPARDDLNVSEHGTEVAGVIGANTNNGLGLTGVVWSGPLLSVAVLDGNGSGSTADLAAGLNYAVQQGARVINISLGAPDLEGDAVLDAALTNATKSAVVVAAAGNTPDEGVYYPASHPDVIAVGAVGSRDGELACYSARPDAQHPRALDIVAPGGVSGQCQGDSLALDIPVLASGGNYKLEAGTSFSAPMVSGVAALMRGVNPGLSAAQTRTLLLRSVNRTGGLPLLDAAAAVRAALP